MIQIRTGEWKHIVADVAWAASEYASGRAVGVPPRPGADLLLETARYWASRVTAERDGRGHIRGVIGPDEYHEDVDDNAFTNVMARWNLRRGADLADELGPRGGRGGWRQIAASLFDGWDAERALRAVRRVLVVGAVADRPSGEPRSPPMSCSATLE